jgi:hypothetical protein
MQITMLATSTDQYQQPHSFSVDTDGVYFIIDNSANGGICNIKSMFVGDFERHRVSLGTAYGRTTTKKLVGTIRLILKDDKGKTWSYDIPDVVYDPESPCSLLSISFLGKYFARNDEANEFDEQTWIQSASTSSLFRWDDGKHQRHFKHGNTYLPELLTNEGETHFSALAYQNLWMTKSSMPFHWHSPHHLTVYHNLTSYQMMTMMKWMKYSGTHLRMCVRMNNQINMFISVDQQNPPNQSCMKLLKLSSS